MMEPVYSTSVKILRRKTAEELISSLYHVHLIPLDSQERISQLCKEVRYHPIQRFLHRSAINALLKELTPDAIFHVSGAFLLHFFLFTVDDIPYFLGPFAMLLLTDREARMLLDRLGLHSLDPVSFQTYRDAFPLIQETQAQEIVSAFIRAVNPEETVKTVRRISQQAGDAEAEMTPEQQRARHNLLLELRYANERAFYDAAKAHLITTFRKETGVTPNVYLTQIRMKQAALLLAQGGMTVSGVSAAVGIPDSNYFVKLFKREYGETPGAYRKQRTT